ncbi:MAG TPA: 50S ribosomal protein L17 [Pyrinomonadaceae bacterium]|nr:50S ribosomal protein L17 [Pyrinomonadaceae bacterium]
MRHLNAHRKLGRTSEHRMSLLRNLATSLINARDERIKTTVQKAKELRPFVERAITLAKRAGALQGDDASAQTLHLRRQAASFFHAGNQGAGVAVRRGQPRAPRTAGVAALKRLFDELGERYKDRPGGYTRIIRLGHRDGDNAELAFIELVDNPREREAAAASSKRPKSASSGKKSAKKGGKAETSSAGSTKKEGRGERRSKKTESTAAEQETE